MKKNEHTTLLDEATKLDDFYASKRRELEKKLAIFEESARAEAAKLAEEAKAARRQEAGALAVELLKASTDADNAANTLAAALKRRRELGHEIKAVDPESARAFGNYYLHADAVNGAMCKVNINIFADVKRSRGSESLYEQDQRYFGVIAARAGKP